MRLTRFLYNEARLDTPNLEMRHNGELLVQRVVAEHAPNGRELVVFDVGAHVGEWITCLLQRLEANRVERYRCFCFEPSPDSRTKLEGAVRTANVRVVPVALSDTVGTADLHITGGGVSSLHEQATRPTRKLERVETMPLDSFCDDAGVDVIDLLKVDVEGHDMAVICGATRLLEERRIGVLQFEYNHRWVMARAFLRDVFTLLVPLGYQLGKVTPLGIEFYPGWHPDLENYSQGNYLACREEWAARFPSVPWYLETGATRAGWGTASRQCVP